MRVPLQWLLSPPAPLLRLVILLAAQQTLRPVLRRRSPVKSISEKHKKEAVVALRKLVPPLPSPLRSPPNNGRKQFWPTRGVLVGAFLMPHNCSAPSTGGSLLPR